MKTIITLSLFLSAVLCANSFINPLPNSVKSIDNGGIKSAIDAYRDGIGAELVDQPGIVTDNSTMNVLTIKYGESAKFNNTTILNQVLFGSTPIATDAEKDLANKLLLNGASCSDGNSLTTGEIWLNGLCQGGLKISLKSCKEILSNGYSIGNGIYEIDPDGENYGNNSFNVLCDMITDNGGWTLVWSNLKNKSGELQENLSFNTATKTLPIFNGTLNSNKERFEVYTGLDQWNLIGGNIVMDIMYEWRYDYNTPVTQLFIAKLDPFNQTLYQLNISNYQQIIGSVTATIYLYSNGMSFSAIDQDNDLHTGNCAGFYTNTPWWYKSCWSGSFNGGGVNLGSGYLNAAYWSGTAKIDGTINGAGGGNGWIWIR